MLAVLLAFGPIPAEAREPVFDALSHLLNEYAGPVDEKAAEAPPGENAPPGIKLAQVQSDLALMAEGFETFRHPSHSSQAIATLPETIIPELKPYFKDRDSSLDTIYRSLAVTDYTWAARFPEPPCDPQSRRRKLLSAKDGLFTDPKTGALSPWLERLLGPAAAGRTAEEALDTVSGHQTPSARDYELLRLRARKISEALQSEKAVGGMRSKLYCARAQAFEDLAAAHQTSAAGPIQAGRGQDRKDSADSSGQAASVVLMARVEGPEQYRSLGAGIIVDTSHGPRILTDSRLLPDLGEDKPSLRVFARPADGKTLGPALAFAMEKIDRPSGVMVGRLEGGERIPALKLAGAEPAKDDLVRAIGHMGGAGAWTVSQGLVTNAGKGTFSTDALLGPDMLGGALLNDQGEVVGLAVLPNAAGAPAAVGSSRLREILEGPSQTAASAVIEFIESQNRGSASILTTAMPTIGAGLTAPGAKPIEASEYIYSQTQWGTVRGKCMANCGGGSSSSGYSSGYDSSGAADLGQALGKAMAPLVEALIFKGIPALFRGIGSLFSNSKSAPSSPPARSAATWVPVPAPVPAPVKIPEKPKEPLTLTDLTLEVSPASAAPGEKVTLTARVSLNDPAASKANIIVGFKANPVTVVDFDGKAQAKTDASGMATIVGTLRNDHGVRALKTGDFKGAKGKADRAQSELDAEMRGMGDDASAEFESTLEKAADERISFEATAKVVRSATAKATMVISSEKRPECRLEAVDVPESIGGEPFTVKFKLTCPEIDGTPRIDLTGHEIALDIGWKDMDPQYSLTLHTNADGYAFATFQSSGNFIPLQGAVAGQEGGQFVNAANETAVLEPIKETDPAIRQISAVGGSSASILWRVKFFLSPTQKLKLMLGGGVIVVVAGWQMYDAQKKYDKAMAEFKAAHSGGKLTPECKDLDVNVGRRCKGPPRSCKETEVSPEDCDELRIRLSNNSACIAARKLLMDKCFGGGDPRHERELDRERKAFAACEDRL